MGRKSKIKGLGGSFLAAWVRKIRQAISLVEGYFLFLLFCNFFYFCLLIRQNPIPLTSESFLELSIFSAVICILQIFHVEIEIHGSRADLDLADPFILCLFYFKGPGVALISYAVGITFYQLFRKFPIRALVAMPLVNVFNYGFAFSLFSFADRYWNFHENIFLRLVFLLILQTMAEFFTLSVYAAKTLKKGQWEVLKTELASGLRLRFLVILLFPALASIAIIFWQAHDYVSAILLLVPFYLIRWSMQSAIKAVDQIMNTISSLVDVIEAKDNYTAGHCKRVARYAMVIATFADLPSPIIQNINHRARMHDLLKIKLQDKVLKKEGRLTDDEYEEIKTHTDPDKAFVNQIPNGHPFKEIFEQARHHHEWWDSGEKFHNKAYPDHWTREEIPIEIRVIAMADAYDAMTSDRCYRSKLSREKLLEQISTFEGKQWEPWAVQALLAALKAGALDAVKDLKEVSDAEFEAMINTPPASWEGTSLPDPVPYSPRIRQRFLAGLSFNWRQLFWFAAIAAIAVAFYSWPPSRLFHNPVILYIAFALGLEFYEMRIEKLTTFHPAEMVYLSSLFLLRTDQVLALILAGTLTPILYFKKLEFKRCFEAIYRILLFAVLSPIYFKWAGLGDGQSVFLWQELFDHWLSFCQVILLTALWGLLYTAGRFLLDHLELMFRRKSWVVSWYLPAFQASAIFEFGLVVPGALTLITFSAVNQIYFPALMGSFALVILVSYPLLLQYVQVVSGNIQIFKALSNTAFQRRPYYAKQMAATANLGGKLCEKVGCSDQEIVIYKNAVGMSHLSYVGISDEVLDAAHKPTPEQWGIIRKHPEMMRDIISRCSFLKEESPIMLHHHERWDGAGYPGKLRGNQIPKGSRIFAVSEAFFAMIAPRPYHEAYTVEKALTEIKQNAGTQFDPDIVERFIKVIEEEKKTNPGRLKDLSSPLPAQREQSS